MSNPSLKPGYAESSTRRFPIAPTTVVVGEEECGRARFVGPVRIDGNPGWNAFRDPQTRRYYFQLAVYAR
jgi:hypothetical protein